VYQSIESLVDTRPYRRPCSRAIRFRASWKEQLTCSYVYETAAAWVGVDALLRTFRCSTECEADARFESPCVGESVGSRWLLGNPTEFKETYSAWPRAMRIRLIAARVREKGHESIERIVHMPLSIANRSMRSPA
jgi:hypothetical protein